MIRFTNKCTVFAFLLLLTAACSQPDEPVITEKETVVVEEEPQTPPVKVAEEQTREPALPQEPVKPQEAQKQPAPSAKTLYPNEVILQLKSWDKNLSTLKTSFRQNTLYDGVPINMSHGNLYYSQAGSKLRLDTLNESENVEQSAVTDKQKIVILDGQGRPITTVSWEEWQKGQPNQALFDFGNYTALLDRHHIEMPKPYTLVLTPKQGDENYTLTLELDETDYFPKSIKIESDLTVTEAILSETQKNKVLDFELFGGFF